jgi:hypothetical protein
MVQGARTGSSTRLGVEHRLLKAGVHRLRVSDANPRPSIFFGVPLARIVTARSSAPRLSGRSARWVRTQRTQAAINTTSCTRSEVSSVTRYLIFMVAPSGSLCKLSTVVGANSKIGGGFDNGQYMYVVDANGEVWVGKRQKRRCRTRR